MSLASRSVTSVTWAVLGNTLAAAVAFGRSIILARLLNVETFGVYAQATALVALTAVFTNFGLSDAYLHRAEETQEEQQSADVLLMLMLALTAIWATALVGAALLFMDGDLRTAVLWLTFALGGLNLARIPSYILTRRVVHRRLAAVRLLTVAGATVISVVLALQGMELWALLATDLAVLGITVLLLSVWRPVWRPRPKWSRPVVRYYLSFGGRGFLSSLLLQALNRVDDLWTAGYLGQTALGFYSRAYAFATYPRQLLASPINDVAGGTYAELKDDRDRLSQAFFRTNALLVRSSFFLGGLLALVSPEFIGLVLGDKWLPMLTAFRLMLVFTLLDPIKVTVASLFVAVGRPEKVLQVRLVQLAVLVAGLFGLGLWLDIAGVALAVDLMLVVGIALLLWQSRRHVQFSARRLFAGPAAGLAAGLAAGWLVARLPGLAQPTWQSGLLKGLAFTLLFGGTLLLLERKELGILVSGLRQLRPRGGVPLGEGSKGVRP
jgi:O-antigen/teichoic acid export membrane protein